jgi:SiaC family regulatory phosphoprotein
MESLKIPETRRTPLVSFNAETGILEISGYRSMPEASSEFYDPIINWMDEYITHPITSSTSITFKLEYFNTSTGKCFVDILKRLDDLAASGHEVLVKWFYDEEDEDMLQSGDDMQATVENLSIEKIPYKNNPEDEEGEEN